MPDDPPSPVVPPRPASRPDKVTLWQRIRLARQDLFAAQPARLYNAQMAELKTPFYNSYFINQPDIVKTILLERPEDFPKSGIIRDGLKLLLGESVFVTNGTQWQRQRRIIDPAFEGGRIREAFPAMVDAGEACVARLTPRADGSALEIEFETAHAAADVIFRTLFSIPITDRAAQAVYHAFRAYQRAQPLMSFLMLIKAPAWLPRYRPRASRRAAREIRRLLGAMIDARAAEIAAGTAPDDLATKIMTTTDPVTGERFGAAEMVDQVCIFFLAGHETSASALAWTLYLMAIAPAVQERVAAEVRAGLGDRRPDFADLRALPFTRDVFREALRLYPPVPMMVREATRSETFRRRSIAPGSLCILSPWHLQRHERVWPDPDVFDPDRWQRPETRAPQRDGYMPFSAGPRVCPGAGFAMAEGVVLLAMLIRAFRVEPVAGRTPRPVTHLTVRSEDGIWLRLTPRSANGLSPDRASG